MGGKTATTTQSVSIPPEVMARYNAVNARAEQVAGRPFQSYGTTPEAFVAPLTPTQQAGIQATNVYSQAAQPFYGAATGLTLAGAQNVGPLTRGQIGYYESPYTEAVAMPTYAALRQQQGQELAQQQANAIRSGAAFGERSGLERANLQRQQALGTAQALAPIYQQGYQTALQTAAGQQGVVAQDLARRMQAGQQVAGLGAAAQQAALSGAQAQLAAGQMQQQTEQAGKQALYNQFLQEQGYPFQVAQFLANIAMGTGALSGSTTTTQQPTGFFSDERLKENVEPVGELYDGQKVYRYEMGDGRKQIGLIAQDVEQRHPEAVGLAAGYKTVDYGKATDDAVDRSKLYHGGVASEGGAVSPERAGLGFAIGGSAAFDQDLVKQILANQAGMYSKFYGQEGTPRGVAGAPGATGRVPPANLPVGKVATAGTAPTLPKSGLSQAAETGTQFAKLAEMGKGAGQWAFGSENEKTGARERGAFEKVGDYLRSGRPTEGPTQSGKTLDVAMTETDPLSRLEDVPVARDGGRIGYFGGGSAEEKDDDAPQGLYKSEGPGINIPDDKTRYELGKPAPLKDSSAGQSGLGQAVQLASAGKSLYGLGSKGLNALTSLGDAAGIAGAGAAEAGAGLAGAGEAAGAAAGAAEGAGLLSGIGSAAAGVGSAVMEALPFVAMMFSDERMKSDKEPVGELYDGQKVYRYNIDGGPTQIGLMAQEVEKREPGAVGEVAGLKAVNYHAATDKAAGLAPRRSKSSRRRRALGGADQIKENVDVNTSGLNLDDLIKVEEKPATETRPPEVVASATETVRPAEGVRPPEEVKPQSNFDYSVKKTLKFEGGLNPRDTNGAPSLYGINKAANPDVDFATLTPGKATQIYKARYWDAINGDRLPPELAHVAFDTAVIAGPAKAKSLIQASGGDPLKFLDLRQQFQDSLLERNPEKYGKYARAWNNRVAELRRDVTNGIPGSEPPAEGVAAARVEPTGVTTTRLRPDGTPMEDQSGTTVQPLAFAPPSEGGVSAAKLPDVITKGPGAGDTGVAAAKPTQAALAKPGLAGHYRAYEDAEASPWRFIGEKFMPEGTPSALKSENFWIPLIAGVGSMLASNRPTLGGAIGEGLVGGAAAYSAQQAQQADIAKSQATAEKTMAEIVNSSFDVKDGILMMRVRRPDGTYEFMPWGDYVSLDPSKRPDLDPRLVPIAKYMEAVSKMPSKEGAAQPSAGAPRPGAVETRDLPPPAEKPAEKPAEAAPGAPATTTAPGARAPVFTLPEPKVGPSGLPTTVGVSAAQREAAAKAAYDMSLATGTVRSKALENDFFDPQQRVATAARNQQQQLIPLSGVFAALPKDKSIATSGRAQDVLQPVVATLSNLAAMAGKPNLVIDTEKLTNQEEVKKLVNQLQAGNLKEAQLRAVSAFQQMAEGIPDLVNSPGGQARLMAQLLTSGQMNIDKDRFFADWQKAAAGNRGQFSPFIMHTSRDANRAFDSTYSEAFYANERKMLEKMFKDTIPGTKSESSGGDITVMEYLAKNGGRLGPKAKASVVEKYGPGILRYFGIPE